MSALKRSKSRYQPTYRLESKQPYNKAECEELIKTYVDTTMQAFVYQPDEAETLSKTMSMEIMNKVKGLNYDRYKFVCVVTIGEKYMQSFCDMFRCLWDMQKDRFACYVHEAQNVFAVVALYAVYWD